jgi:hypothetical protein
MRSRLKAETRNLFALIAFMALVAAGLFFAAESLKGPPKTAQLAVPFESSGASPAPENRPL